MLFHRSQRFADSRPEFTGDLTEGIQDVFLSCRLRLLLGEDIPGAATLCAQAQNVLASEAGNRAFEDGGAGGSRADFLSELRRQARIRRLAHQSQRLLDTGLRDQAKKR